MSEEQSILLHFSIRAFHSTSRPLSSSAPYQSSAGGRWSWGRAGLRAWERKGYHSAANWMGPGKGRSRGAAPARCGAPGAPQRWAGPAQEAARGLRGGGGRSLPSPRRTPGPQSRPFWELWARPGPARSMPGVPHWALSPGLNRKRVLRHLGCGQMLRGRHLRDGRAWESRARWPARLEPERELGTALWGWAWGTGILSRREPASESRAPRGNSARLRLSAPPLPGIPRVGHGGRLRDREGTAVPRGGRGAAALGAAEAAGGGTVGPRVAGCGRRARALLRSAAGAAAASGRPGGRWGGWGAGRCNFGASRPGLVLS